MKIKSNKTFSITKSNHIIIECNINSVAAKLIIDTGASNSCLDSSSRKKFNLKCEKSIDEASSANSRIDEIFYSKNNTLEINNIKKNDFEIVVFDMTHINNSLKEKGIDKVDGIIGGDILIEFNADINYKKKILNLEF